MRLLIAAGVWLLATVAATGIVWGAVSVVVADVTDSPAPTVAHRYVVDALHSATTAPPTSVAAAGSAAHLGPPPTVGAARPLTGGTLPLPGNPVPPAASLLAPPLTAASRVIVPPVAKVSPLPMDPATTTVPTPPDPSATYAAAGGVVTVACHGSSIRLVSASPMDGYAANVISSGPLFVAIHFDGTARSYPVTAVCLFGLPLEGTTLNANGLPGNLMMSGGALSTG